MANSSGLRIDARGVSRVFDDGFVAFEEIDLSVAAGEFVALLGPSGCGKSTLLRLIAGLDTPQAGRAEIQADESDSGDGGAYARRVAFVFQDAHLLPWRNVLDNVALPLELQRSVKSERHDAAFAAIKRVGLADAAAKYPAQLSGGMRMRVSLARAMVTEPALLLLDEPFAALDEITRQRLDEQLRELWLSTRMTVVFVTHSTVEATFLATRAVVLGRKPARIVDDRVIDLPEDRPASIRGTPAFAAEMHHLHQALVRGGA